MTLSFNSRALFLLFIFLTAIGQSSESHYQAKISMIKPVVVSSIAGLSLYAGIHYLAKHEIPSVKNHLGSYLLITGISSLLGTWIAKKYSFDAYFSHALQGVEDLSNDRFLNFICISLEENKKTITECIKDFYYQEKYPLLVAFDTLSRTAQNLLSYEESLYTALKKDKNSSIQFDTYQSIFMSIELYKELIKELMQKIKDEPNFLAESNAYSIEISSDAAKSIAVASWIHAFNH